MRLRPTHTSSQPSSHGRPASRHPVRGDAAGERRNDDTRPGARRPLGRAAARTAKRRRHAPRARRVDRHRRGRARAALARGPAHRGRPARRRRDRPAAGRCRARTAAEAVTASVRILATVATRYPQLLDQDAPSPSPEFEREVTAPLRAVLERAQAEGAIRDDVPLEQLGASLRGLLGGTLRVRAAPTSTPPSPASSSRPPARRRTVRTYPR